jgi:hypothetical protein
VQCAGAGHCEPAARGPRPSAASMGHGRASSLEPRAASATSHEPRASPHWRSLRGRGCRCWCSRTHTSRSHFKLCGLRRCARFAFCVPFFASGPWVGQRGASLRRAYPPPGPPCCALPCTGSSCARACSGRAFARICCCKWIPSSFEL